MAVGQQDKRSNAVQQRSCSACVACLLPRRLPLLALAPGSCLSPAPCHSQHISCLFFGPPCPCCAVQSILTGESGSVAKDAAPVLTEKAVVQVGAGVVWRYVGLGAGLAAAGRRAAGLGAGAQLGWWGTLSPAAWCTAQLYCLLPGCMAPW
jgi:hypothetical protein